MIVTACPCPQKGSVGTRHRRTITKAQVRALRDERGHDKHQAAEACRISWRTWHRWERGEVKPDSARLRLYEIEYPPLPRVTL